MATEIPPPPAAWVLEAAEERKAEAARKAERSEQVGEAEGLLSSFLPGVEAEFGGAERRFVALNKGSVLNYPIDLGSQVSDNGIVNWIQFTMFLKKQGGIAGLKQAVSSAISGINPELTATQQESGGGSLVRQEVRLASAGGEDAATGDQICLYLPGGIQFEDSLKYEEVGFGGIKNMTNLSAAGAGFALGMLRKLATLGDKFASVATGFDSFNLGQALSASMGVVANPRKEQNFQDVDMRSFQFSFMFIPRSREEAEVMLQIIKQFRFHALPEVSPNRAFFMFPSEFGIKFMTVTANGITTENTSIPRIKRCYLEKITTNYTPDQVFYAFDRGIPIRVQMTLQFKEASYIARNDIAEGGY